MMGRRKDWLLECKKIPAPVKQRARTDDDTEPDWGRSCKNCGKSPIVPLTGMCGPCTFGEADTVGGNW